MKCRSTILTIADVSHVKRLPDEYVTMILIDIHEGEIEKGDLAEFNGLKRRVLDVATNTDFFDEYIEGSVGVALGGDPVAAAENVGRTLYVLGSR